ncbi:MAG: ribose 5-phosphate isomerase B [candidate division WOR-3 bacterium]
MADASKIKIAIGADHRGFKIKEIIKKLLKEKDFEVIDLGSFSEESSDYPDFAIRVGEEIKEGKAHFGILVCMTGIGMMIAANKVKGIRAALCRDEEDAYLARAHNDANVLALGSKNFKDEEELKRIVLKFVETPFEGGRHERRVKKILDYENCPTGSR